MCNGSASYQLTVPMTVLSLYSEGGLAEFSKHGLTLTITLVLTVATKYIQLSIRSISINTLNLNLTLQGEMDSIHEDYKTKSF